jgi:phosphoserine phosphatase RsbU/P
MHAPLRLLIVADSGDEVLHLVGGHRRGVSSLKAEFSGALPFGVPPGRIVALPERGRKVVVIDYLMANGGGDSALRLLRRNGLSRHAIVVSAMVCEDKAARAMTNGAYDFILKGALTPLPASLAQKMQAAEFAGMRGPEDSPPADAA